jgi:hypothetical protein
MSSEAVSFVDAGFSAVLLALFIVIAYVSCLLSLPLVESLSLEPSSELLSASFKLAISFACLECALCATSDFDLDKAPRSDLGFESVNCNLEMLGMGVVDEELRSKLPNRAFWRGVTEPDESFAEGRTGVAIGSGIS